MKRGLNTMSYYDNYYLEYLLNEDDNLPAETQTSSIPFTLDLSGVNIDKGRRNPFKPGKNAKGRKFKVKSKTTKSDGYSEPIGPTKPETKQAAAIAANAASAQGGTPEQQQQTAEAAANAQGKQKAKMSTKKKIGIGAGAAAGVAGLAIGAKMTYDYAKYKKWKAENPLRKNVTFKQWKSKQKKKLHESFNEGYQAALEEFYY